MSKPTRRFIATISEDRNAPLWGWLHNPDGSFSEITLVEITEKEWAETQAISNNDWTLPWDAK